MTSSTRTNTFPAVFVAAWGTMAATSCQAPLELRYETEHLRIGTSFEEPLCQGNLDHLELVVTAAEVTLATTLDSPVDVYIWTQEEFAEQDWCGDQNTGCYSNGVIYTSLESTEHELIHAVVDSFSKKPAAFWSEGVAEALETDRLLFTSSAPSDNLELEDLYRGYNTAGMFSRWLLETQGADKIRALLVARGDAREVFEATYDMSLKEAEDAYFATAPYSYGAFVACEHPALTQIGDLEWSESVDVDCSMKHVFGGPYGVGVQRVLEISERGVYDFVTSAPSVTIGRCMDEDLEMAPVDGDPANGDIPPLSRVFPEQFVRGFSGGAEPISLDLAPGRYEISLNQSGLEPHTYEVTVSPSVGPIPLIPEPTP